MVKGLMAGRVQTTEESEESKAVRMRAEFEGSHQASIDRGWTESNPGRASAGSKPMVVVKEKLGA